MKARVAPILLIIGIALSVPLEAQNSGRTPTPDELCATEMAGETPTTVEALRFEGLNRTKEVVVLDALELAPGQPYTEETREEIRNDLLSLGLFDRVSVSPDPEAVDGPTVVTVTLRERWTLVPIPFFSTSSAGTQGGLFVIENNLLGYNKQLITGGSYGSGGFSGLLVFSDPAVFFSPFQGSVALSAGRSEESFKDLEGDTIDQWQAAVYLGRLRVGYKLTDRLTLSSGLAYRLDQFDDGDSPEGAESSEAVFYHSGTLSFSDRTPRRYFASGYRAVVEGEYTPLEPGEEWSVSAAWQQDFLLFRDHRLRYALRAEESERALWRASTLGGSETQRTIDRGSLPAERYFTAGVTYEFPVYRPDWGTFTLLGFYEGGLLPESEEYYGPGGGFRMYVSRVTLPALGLDVAYRASEGVWLFSFSIGMSM